MRYPAYRRSQTLWLLWILLPASMAWIVGAMLSDSAGAGGAGAGVVALVAGVPLLALMLLVLVLLGRFTLEIGQGRIEWRFGLIGRPRWSVALADVKVVETTRTRWCEGWGIRRTRRGWLYNAAGFGAIELQLRDGRVIRLGSDEPDCLRSFITARLVKED
jgi:hypothetical protein